MPQLLRDIRLYCVVASWSIWIGGFTFYFSVVVPTGGAIVGGTEQGFVTQQVTHWLNLIGVASLLLMLWNTIAARSRLLVATLSIMAVCQVSLIVMHYRLDALIDSRSRQIIDPVHFRTVHESYEIAATIQWLAGMIHLFGVVRTARQSVTGPGNERSRVAVGIEEKAAQDVPSDVLRASQSTSFPATAEI